MSTSGLADSQGFLAGRERFGFRLDDEIITLAIAWRNLDQDGFFAFEPAGHGLFDGQAVTSVSVSQGWASWYAGSCRAFWWLSIAMASGPSQGFVHDVVSNAKRTNPLDDFRIHYYMALLIIIAFHLC